MNKLDKFKYYAEWTGIMIMGIIGIVFMVSFVIGVAYMLCKLFKMM